MDPLVDNIYEAALAPHMWPQVLEIIGSRFETKGGLLFTNTREGARWLGGGEAEPVMREFIAQGWAGRNDRVQRLVSRGHLGFLTDMDLFSVEELETIPVYVEFLTPRGASAGAATFISGAAGDDLVLSIEGFRDHDAARAACTPLDVLRPHLARAAMISSRLGLERMRAAVGGLQSIGVAAGVVSGGGAIRAANDLFEADVVAQVFSSAARISLVDQRADRQFQIGLAGAVAGRGGASIAVRHPLTQATCILHVLPIVGQAQDLFIGASAIVVVTGHEPAAPPNGKLLEQLFDFSPAEARIARAIAEGFALHEIAARSGASIHTVRTQAKVVLSKTGVSRQAELVALLSGLMLPVRAGTGA